jgi:hypothetical protein
MLTMSGAGTAAGSFVFFAGRRIIRRLAEATTNAVQAPLDMSPEPVSSFDPPNVMPLRET